MNRKQIREVAECAIAGLKAAYGGITNKEIRSAAFVVYHMMKEKKEVK